MDAVASTAGAQTPPKVDHKVVIGTVLPHESADPFLTIPEEREKGCTTYIGALLEV